MSTSRKDKFIFEAFEEDNNSSVSEKEELNTSENLVEDIIESKDNSVEVISHEGEDKAVNNTDNIEVLDFVLDEDSKIEESIEEIVDEPKEKFSLKKMYFSFETRIIMMVCAILLLFLGAFILFLNATNYYKTEKVSYDEYSNVHYQVCLNQNDYYRQSCLDEGMEYVADLTDFVNANFEYNVDFSTDIDYHLAYHVVAVTKIFDTNNTDKVLYKNEEVLLEKTDISNNNQNVFLNTVVKIDYDKYNTNVLNYKNRYSLNSSANVEIMLYLDEDSETRKVASLVLPLGDTTFAIKRNVITNLNRIVEVKEDTWNDFNTICAVIASIFVLISIGLIIQLTRLVFKVVNSKSKYEKRLNEILSEYDRLIVIARDGYSSLEEKQVVKVDSIEELLDARETLQKPIIYSRINDVKSEFLVEDEDKLFKYVLKESDL